MLKRVWPVNCSRPFFPPPQRKTEKSGLATRDYTGVGRLEDSHRGDFAPGSSSRSCLRASTSSRKEDSVCSIRASVDARSSAIEQHTTNTSELEKRPKVLPRGRFYRGALSACVYFHVACARDTLRLTAVFSRKLGLTPLICETEPSEI